MSELGYHFLLPLRKLLRAACASMPLALKKSTLTPVFHRITYVSAMKQWT